MGYVSLLVMAGYKLTYWRDSEETKLLVEGGRGDLRVEVVRGIRDPFDLNDMARDALFKMRDAELQQEAVDGS